MIKKIDSQIFTISRLKITGVLAVILYALSAHAEIIASKPEFKAGSVWRVNMHFPVNCNEWVVKDTNSEGYLVLECDHYESYLDVNNDYNLVKMVDVSTGKLLAEYKPFWPGLKYPMKVGDSWKGNYQGFVSSTGWKWTSNTYSRIVGIEDIQLENKDATYKALKIEMTDSWKDKNNYSGTNYLTYWYVPEFNAVMKMKNSDPRWNY